MGRIVIATRNEKKKEELQRILKETDIKFIGIDNIRKKSFPIVVEDGSTFRQNAVKKALIYSRYVEDIVLADDSGLCVDVLDGKPGIRSSRFAYTGATDRENLEKLLRLMKRHPKRRDAEFVCVIAAAREGRLLFTVTGTCKGRIALEPKGKNGFGYDPVFIPAGYKRTFAQLPSGLKDRVSHRGKALRRVKTEIKKFL